MWPFMQKLENAHLVFQLDGNPRRVPVGDLEIRELRSRNMHDGLELRGRPLDLLTELMLVGLVRASGTLTIEGVRGAEKKSYVGVHVDNGVFHVSD